jgi:hypothetical protein
MADYNQGDVVQDYFSVVDESLKQLLDVEFVVDATEDPDGESFLLEIVEVGDGVYKAFFTAAKTGEYYYRIVTTNVSPEQTFEESWTIATASIYGASTGLAAYTNTLSDLVRRVATRLGDFRQIQATEAGASDGSTFVDNKRLAAIPASSLKGAGITIVSPGNANYNVERRISDSSEANQTLSISPGFPAQVTIGQIGWVTNLQSRGHWWDDYRNAINEIIAGATHHKMPVDYTYPGTFLATDPSIPVPLHMTHIYRVQYLGPDNMLHTVPQSSQNLQSVPGWTTDLASGRVIINGSWPSVLNGATIRLSGYGRPAELVDPGDFTSLNVAYIVPAAASLLRQSKGDAKLLSSASMMSNESIESMLGGITMMEPNTIQVR